MILPPPIGAKLEMLRHNEWGGQFEPAIVVDRLTDPVLGVVLVVEFEGENKRIHRVWPSPSIRTGP